MLRAAWPAVAAASGTGQPSCTASSPRQQGLRQQGLRQKLGGRRLASTASAAANAAPTLLQRYSRLLDTRPLATKGVTAAAIAGLGDVVCQLYMAREKAAEGGTSTATSTSTPTTNTSTSTMGEGVALLQRQEQQGWWREVDLRRTVKFMALSSVLFAPTAHYWYLALAKRVSAPHAGAAAVKRMALDQFLFAPIFTGIFFSLLMVVEGSGDRIHHKLRQDYWPTMKTNWGVWMPAQLINFGLVPQPYQVLFANCVGLGWNIYMSSRAFNELPPAVAEHTPEADDTAIVVAAAAPKWSVSVQPGDEHESQELRKRAIE